jgi:uncharacterized protein YndB with AHSA1/START domain
MTKVPPSMAQRLERVVEYAHPVAKVWRALTEPDQMGLWIMNFSNEKDEMTTDFRPVVGASYRMDARSGRGWRGYVVGKVLEVVPKQRLVYTWAHSAYQDAHPARVEFTLEPTANGTRLRMVQTGFKGLRGWFVRKGAQMGWKIMLKTSLRAVLDGSAPKNR